MITFKKVYKEYANGVPALNDINLEIPKGDFLFLVGPSGAGKSTMVKLLIREIEVTKGNIILDNMDITKISKRKIPLLRRKVGVVFQDFRLLPKKTVYENVAYALEIVGESTQTIRHRVGEVLEMVDLQNKEKSYPAELSGGESQRVSIARAMVNHPDILVCDEPTGNLDFETSKEIMKALETVHAENTTIIMATHARNIVDMMQKRVITLESGRIINDIKSGGYYENTASI
ncbi:MAG: cell division ATP-binding protein FtsE [Tissierellia bacterium]|nr:cell division ATP-binding protein FtsE [Tissierellia bacterium]